MAHTARLNGGGALYSPPTQVKIAERPISTIRVSNWLGTKRHRSNHT